MRPKPDDESVADSLLLGRLSFPHHRPFLLPKTPSWSEDPDVDRNWQFNYHSLRWVDVLRRRYIATGAKTYEDAHRGYLNSWLSRNGDPRRKPSSPMAWYGMATAYRSSIIAAAISTYGPDPDLMNALNEHGAFLADENAAFEHGNHALHVRTALLVIADILQNEAWKRYALQTLDDIVRNSVDLEGVDVEGAMAYQHTNYGWFQITKKHLIAAKLKPSNVFQRVDAMPDFVGYGTGPDLHPVPFGDSDRLALRMLPGSVVEWVASQGTRGSVPADVYRTYAAGYLFARTTWDLPADQTQIFYTLRYGPKVTSHAHCDGGSITLMAGVTPLLLESGRYKYQKHENTDYLKSNFAHNSVVFPNDPYNEEAPTSLVQCATDADHDWTVVMRSETHGSTWQRGIYHSRTHRYLIVIDSIVATRAEGAAVLWQLPTEAAITLEGRCVTSETSELGMDISSFCEHGDLTLTVKKGQKGPMLGWRSDTYGKIFEAPTIQASTKELSNVIVTVIAPRGTSDPQRTANLVFSEDSVELDVAGVYGTESVRLQHPRCWPPNAPSSSSNNPHDPPRALAPAPG